MTMDFDFAANPTVESLEVVPEKYRGLFQEGEGDNAGKFVVSPAAAGLVADYTGLAKAAAGLRQEKKSASDESATRRHALKSIEDSVTGLGVEVGEEGIVAAIEAFVTDLQQKVKGGESLKVDLGKIKAQFDQQLADGLKEKDGEVASMMAALRKHMITSAALAALAKQKGSAELLLPHVQSSCEVVKDDSGEYVVRVKDPEGTYRINGSGAFMGVDDLVADLKTKDAFARAFESEEKGGTGSPPGALNRQAPRQGRELSSTEKIRAGLKRQERGGFGTAAR